MVIWMNLDGYTFASETRDGTVSRRDSRSRF
jgi:hypothetical protein